MPVAAGVDVDPGDPSAYIAYMAQDGLGLPDRDYYLKDEPEFLKAGLPTPPMSRSCCCSLVSRMIRARRIPASQRLCAGAPPR